MDNMQKFLAIAVLAASVTSVEAAVTVSVAPTGLGTAIGNSSNSFVYTLAQPFTTLSSSSSILLVGITGTASGLATTATFGSQNMTYVPSSGGANIGVAVYALDLGNEVGEMATITLSGIVSGLGGRGIRAYAMQIAGADYTTLNGKTQSLGNVSPNSITTDPLAAGSFVFDVLYSNTGATAADTFRDGSTGPESVPSAGLMSTAYKTNVSGSLAFGWNFSKSSFSDLAVVSVAPIPEPATGMIALAGMGLMLARRKRL